MIKCHNCKNLRNLDDLKKYNMGFICRICFYNASDEQIEEWENE